VVVLAGAHVAAATLAPPPHLPDLHLLMNAVLSCGMFSAVYLWAVMQLLRPDPVKGKVKQH
jgi:hypothetical protein